MKKFYLRIEEIYTNPENYPLEVRNVYAVWEPKVEVDWEYLGTEDRMKELGLLIDRARRLAVTDTEKKRVQLWKKAVWDYMVEGRKTYLAKSK